LRQQHGTVVLYDCHSIRSRIPRLFEGELPNFNIGTNSGKSCAPHLTAQIETLCAETDFERVTNGRFKGGYTTRHHGQPANGVHAVQMELACRGYMTEPDAVNPGNWPTAYDAAKAEPLRVVLERILTACIEFATSPKR
jgi:formiminoglutamase